MQCAHSWKYQKTISSEPIHCGRLQKQHLLEELYSPFITREPTNCDLSTMIGKHSTGTSVFHFLCSLKFVRVSKLHTIYLMKNMMQRVKKGWSCLFWFWDCLGFWGVVAHLMQLRNWLASARSYTIDSFTSISVCGDKRPQKISFDCHMMRIACAMFTCLLGQVSFLNAFCL